MRRHTRQQGPHAEGGSSSGTLEQTRPLSPHGIRTVGGAQEFCQGTAKAGGAGEAPGLRRTLPTPGLVQVQLGQATAPAWQVSKQAGVAPALGPSFFTDRCQTRRAGHLRVPEPRSEPRCRPTPSGLAGRCRLQGLRGHSRLQSSFKSHPPVASAQEEGDPMPGSALWRLGTMAPATKSRPPAGRAPSLFLAGQCVAYGGKAPGLPHAVTTRDLRAQHTARLAHGGGRAHGEVATCRPPPYAAYLLSEPKS